MVSSWIQNHGEYLFLIFILGAIGFLMIRQHLLNNAPEHTASARIISRRMEPGRYHGRCSSGWNYLVTFQLTSGEKLELFTGEAEYAELKEGLYGKLVWQHDNFLSFDTDDI